MEKKEEKKIQFSSYWGPVDSEQLMLNIASGIFPAFVADIRTGFFFLIL